MSPELKDAIQSVFKPGLGPKEQEEEKQYLPRSVISQLEE